MLQADHLTQPRHLLIVFVRRADALSRFLVLPMRRNAVLRDLVHGEGTNLDLQRIAAAYYGRMQRLVAVRLRHGDVVFEASGQGLPHRMDDAEHAVAVLDRIDEHAQRRKVVDLADVLLIALHLLINAVKMLGAPLNLRRHVRLFKLFHDLLMRLVDERLTLLPLLLDALDESIVCLGIEITQAQILKLPFDIRYAETIRERCIDLKRLLGNAVTFVLAHVFERAHIVQAVRELDQDNADIL